MTHSPTPSEDRIKLRIYKDDLRKLIRGESVWHGGIEIFLDPIEYGELIDEIWKARTDAIKFLNLQP